MRRRALVVPMTVAASLGLAAGGAQAVWVQTPASRTLAAGGAQAAWVQTPASRGLQAHLVLMPQTLGTVVRDGVSVQVSANEAADGIATVTISRTTAKLAQLQYGRGATVVIGQGTVSGIKNGNVKLDLRLSRAVASKLGRLQHAILNVRLALVAAGGDHVAVDATGRY